MFAATGAERVLEHLANAWAALAETWTGDWAAIWVSIVWAWHGLEFTGPIFLGGIGAIFGTIYAVLRNDDNLEFVRTLCRRDPLATTWYRVVNSGLTLVERLYGPAWSGKAFGRSLQIALIYPAFAIFTGLAFGGPFAFGQLEFDRRFGELAPDERFAVVLYAATMFTAFSSLFWLFFSSRSPWRRFLAAWRNRLVFDGKSTWHVYAVRLVVVLGGVFGMMVAAGAIGAIVMGDAFNLFNMTSVLVSLIALLAVGVGPTIGRVFAVVFYGVCITAGAVGTAIAGAANSAVTAVGSIVAFYLALIFLAPVLNAAFDTVSWYWTRRYLRDLFPEIGPRRIGILRAVDHLVRDFLLAVLFLVILAVVLVGVFAFWSEVLRLSGVPNGFPWRDYLRSAQDNPFGAGIGVTMMLITTLVPTFLHFLATFFALAMPSIGWLWGDKTSTEQLRARLSRWWLTVITLGAITLSLFMLVPAAVTTHSIIAGLFGGIGPGLAALAEGSGNAVESTVRALFPVSP